MSGPEVLPGPSGSWRFEAARTPGEDAALLQALGGSALTFPLLPAEIHEVTAG